MQLCTWHCFTTGAVFAIYGKIYLMFSCTTIKERFQCKLLRGLAVSKLKTSWRCTHIQCMNIQPSQITKLATTSNFVVNIQFPISTSSLLSPTHPFGTFRCGLLSEHRTCILPTLHYYTTLHCTTPHYTALLHHTTLYYTRSDCCRASTGNDQPHCTSVCHFKSYKLYELFEHW